MPINVAEKPLRKCATLRSLIEEVLPVTDALAMSRRSFFAMPLLLSACKPGQAAFEISGVTMGTTINVVAVDQGSGVTEGDLRAAINAALIEVNAGMSNWDAGSEISRFNARQGTDPVMISPQLADVMQAAEAVHVASQGSFDTTMGPLIELWGFGAPGAQAMPTEAEIENARTQSGQGNTLKLGVGQVQKRQANAQVYLAAIGKGYGADHVGRAISSLGIKDFMVEIGGDLYASGQNPQGQPWQIGVEKPTASDRGVMEVIGVSGMGLASSGDYRNYFEQDGQRFSHVIDPATGRPITHKTASATVLAENAMLADAWATAMLTLGRARGLEIAQTHDIAVLFAERSGSGFETIASDAFANLTS